MKPKLSLIALFVLCLSFIGFQCDEDTLPVQEEEQAELTALKTEIESLANTSVCNESTECKFIAFGSKPCGGPWSYLVYSTSIDTENLEALVEIYNDEENLFNTKWGVASDCSLAQQPSDLICENNTCVPVF